MCLDKMEVFFDNHRMLINSYINKKSTRILFKTTYRALTSITND